MKKLNGWYRLWIVISVLWVVLCGAVYWDSFSRLSDTKTAKFELSNPKNELEKRVIRVVFPESITEKEIGEYIDTVVGEHGDKAYSMLPDKSDKPYLDYVASKRPKIVKEIAIISLVPIFGVFILGVAISWVANGFKNSKAKA